MKINKKYSKIIVLGLTVFLVGCSGGDDTNKPVETETTQIETTQTETTTGSQTSKETPVVSLNGELSGLEGPVYLTSVGQSADVSMLDALMRKAELEYEFNATATVDDIASAKTLVIAAGSSSKGLGAAGISVEDEEARAKEILEKCKADGITVIMAHLGGEARRGDISDKFSDLVTEYSQGMIVVEDGNKDGRFTDDAAKTNTPIVLVNTIADVTEPLKNMFN